MNSFAMSAKGWAILIFGFLACIQALHGVYFSHHTEMPGPSALLEWVVLFTLIGYWLTLDSRDHRTVRVSDMGFLLYVAWPFILPYYLLKTRGFRRSLYIFLLLIVDYFGAFVVGRTLFGLAA